MLTSDLLGKAHIAVDWLLVLGIEQTLTLQAGMINPAIDRNEADNAKTNTTRRMLDDCSIYLQDKKILILCFWNL
jgi:hypothetical protein